MPFAALFIWLRGPEQYRPTLWVTYVLRSTSASNLTKADLDYSCYEPCPWCLARMRHLGQLRSHRGSCTKLAGENTPKHLYFEHRLAFLNKQASQKCRRLLVEKPKKRRRLGGASRPCSPKTATSVANPPTTRDDDGLGLAVTQGLWAFADEPGVAFGDDTGLWFELVQDNSLM